MYGVHAAHGPYGTLDQPAAGGAPHSLDEQQDLAPAVTDLDGERRLQLWPVVCEPLGPDGVRLWRIGPRRVGGPEVVVAGQARLADEFRNGLASRAADGLVAVVERHEIPSSGRDGLAAVEAGSVANHCGCLEGGWRELQALGPASQFAGKAPVAVRGLDLEIPAAFQRAFQPGAVRPTVTR